MTGMGKYNFASSIVSYFLLIAGLGINMFAVREGARLRDNRKKFSEFASKILTINLISTIISYVLLIIILLAVSSLHNYSSAILIFSLQIFLTTIGVNWLFVIFEEYGYITLRNILFKIVSIALLFIFVRNSNDYINYACITVFASTGSNILNFFYAKKFCDFKLNFNFNYSSYIKPILVIFASTIAIQIYVNSDVTMLGFIKGDYSVGIYNVAVKVYTIAASLLASILAVTIPRLSMLMGQNRLNEYNKLLKDLLNTLLVLVVPAMVGLFILSKDVSVLLGGSKYIKSAESLKILCFAMIFKLFCSVFNECVLIPVKRENKSLLAFSFAAVLNIGLNFILIPLFAEKGAALTTVLAESSAMLINLYYGRDIIIPIVKNKATFHNIFTVFIGSLIIVGTCEIIKGLVSSVVIKICLQVLLSVVFYFGILKLMKNPVVGKLLFQFKHRII